MISAGSGPSSRPISGLPREVDGLRGMRDYAGKTQAEVAAAMGASQQTVQRMEQSWPHVKVRSLLAYAQALGGEARVFARFPRLGTVEVTIGGADHGGTDHGGADHGEKTDDRDSRLAREKEDRQRRNKRQ